MPQSCTTHHQTRKESRKKARKKGKKDRQARTKREKEREREGERERETRRRRKEKRNEKRKKKNYYAKSRKKIKTQTAANLSNSPSLMYRKTMLIPCATQNNWGTARENASARFRVGRTKHA